MASKRFKKLPAKTFELPQDTIEKILPVVKKNCTTKFEESIDLSLQINNKQKKGDVNLRTVVNLPSGTGKKIKVAVVCEDAKTNDAKEAGADIVGSDEFIDKIKDGELNFEKLICTPSMMIKLSKVGKILGPKGLMPNPKLGTVTNDISKTVKSIKEGQVVEPKVKIGSDEWANKFGTHYLIIIYTRIYRDLLLLRHFKALLFLHSSLIQYKYIFQSPPKYFLNSLIANIQIL
mgnify:CR=1 FL=1